MCLDESLKNMASAVVDLGFVEKVENPLSLSSIFFPSKVGGKPSWLDLQELPGSGVLICRSCKKPLVFLLQVYAPVAEEERSFHRTIFLFCCKNGQCYEKNSNNCFAVFRSQLRRENSFYSREPPPDFADESTDLEKVEREISCFVESNNLRNLCNLCGCRADKKCAGCHSVSYCSREHQTIDWKTGHKVVCKSLQESNPAPALQPKDGSFLFPEYELVTEPESMRDEDREMSEEQALKDYKKFMSFHQGIQSDGKGEEEFERLASVGKEALMADKQFKKFQKRIGPEPQQVIRYDRGGDPLWISDEHIPSVKDVPGCCCGAKRQFEFQVMPQLLNHLKADSVDASIDWGTLAVYTCVNSCGDGPSYQPEFLWKQDFTETGTPAEILSEQNKVI